MPPYVSNAVDEMTLKRGKPLYTFPTLETERLILRQLRIEDSFDLFKYFSMDEVTEYYDLDSFTELIQAVRISATSGH
jgi:RimJ/RimL family protein N-acetyltransferase